MKILILSFYYPPDLSAGSFRAAALIDGLVGNFPSGEVTIDVITTQPNRYYSYSQAAPETETIGMVTVRRITLPSHKSGMIDQGRAFFSYFRGVMSNIRGQHYDLVYATSSRLFTAFLGSLIAKNKRARLYLDIRDIFVDTIKDVLPPRIRRVALPVFSLIEKFTFKRADRINVVSEGFLPYFQKHYPLKSYDCFTNGIDDAFLDQTDHEVTSTERSRRLVLYAGNIGEGQGLHRILPQLAKLSAERFDFLVIGDGGRRQMLEDAIAEANVTNITIRKPVNRDELIRLYRSADVLFLHLNAYEAFLKVLPSKLFEYAATGKPILAGVSGYPKQFIQNEVENASVFTPCDPDAGSIALHELRCSNVSRQGFIEKYRRTNIMNRMAQTLIELAS